MTKDALFFWCTYIIFAQMKLIIALIIQIQVFSLDSAVDLDDSKVAAKRVKRSRSACTQPPETPDKKYEVKYPYDGATYYASPEDEVPEFASIISKCNKGYTVDYGNDKYAVKKLLSFCINGLWEPPILKCKRFCKTFSRLSNFNMTCHQYYGGPEVSCTKMLLEGAIVIPKCQKKFRPNTNVNYNYSTCLPDGTWDKAFFKCVPDCGVASNSFNLIANGENRGGSPWYVAIYSSEFSPEKPEFICGGTLINAELVISAAHCFYNETFQKKPDIEYYSAIVGKATPDFEIKDYNTTETYRLKKIFYPDTFKGDITNYSGDIVVLQLSEKVIISPDVFPACVYWDDRDRFSPGENETGKLSGFGEIADGLFPSVLITADLPSISYSDCLTKVEEDFQGSISVDKFCAGSRNGIGARKNDSGGGLLFKDIATGLYHLRGVLSSKDSNGSTIATFTDVAQHMSWILQIIQAVEYNASEISCEEPEVPPHVYITGYNFNIRSIIKYHCESGYLLIGESELICTDEGEWNNVSPSYVDCGKLPDIKDGSVHYSHGTTHLGSQVTYNCIGEYSLSDPLAVRTCLPTGNWSGEEPQCLREPLSSPSHYSQQSALEISCDKPEVPQGGYISGSDYNVDSIIQFHCEPGYLMYGESELICKDDGKWDDTSPTCEYIDCGKLPPIKNGSIQYLNGTTHLGSQAVYDCDDDYRVLCIEDPIRTCLSTGVWSNLTILCVTSEISNHFWSRLSAVWSPKLDFDRTNGTTCGKPEVPEGGYITGSDYNVDSIIQFHCNPGYLLNGKSKLFCTSEGEWDDAFPTCEYIDCGKLPSIKDGSVQYLNGTTHLGSQAIYTCNENYTTFCEGDPIRTCLPTRTWSNKNIQCVACEDEHTLQSILDGIMFLALNALDEFLKYGNNADLLKSYTEKNEQLILFFRKIRKNWE